MVKTVRGCGVALAGIMIALFVAAGALAPTSAADPIPPAPGPQPPAPPWPCVYGCLRPDSEMIQPLPVIPVTASNWVPKFPYPYDHMRNLVTDADINAEREMCQWFNANYFLLSDQIDRLQFNRVQQNGPGVRVGSGTDWDYSVPGLQPQVDIVTANIQQALDFLTPRALALTVDQDHSNDNFFPLYQAESFYRLWQQLSNVNDGILAHQPDWFTGPSVQQAKRFGEKIHRSHVCD